MKKFVTREIEEQRARDIINEGDCMEEEGITYHITEPWRDEGKYQYQEVVFQEEGFEGYWMLSVTRSGSYFSDYDFQYDTTATQVKPVEKISISWVGVREED